MSGTSDIEARDITLSRRALKTLGEIPGLGCGGLSPLARIAPPDAPSDRQALLDVLVSLDGPLASLVPALLDPRCTIALLFGDGDTTLMGQYLWPDGYGRGPGFRIVVDSDEVRFSGPLSSDEVWLSCLDVMSANAVVEVEPLQMTFDLDQFWATLTLLDAYRVATLRRRLSRLGGDPAGVSSAGLAEAWKTGLAAIDPGWSVPLFALLRPDLVPERFDERVPGVIDRMDAAGILAKLPGDPGDPLGDVYIFGEGLDRLCRAVIQGAMQIGLSVERLMAAGEIELTTFGGWRTPSGFWLADLSLVPMRGTGTVNVTLLGRSPLSALIEGAVGARAGVGADGGAEATPAPIVRDGPYTREALIAALRALPSAGTAPAVTAATPAIAAASAPPAIAAPAAPPPLFVPTHGTPPEGTAAWAVPDGRTPSIMLPGELPIALVERVGDWARVVAENGWSGWVDGRRFG